MFFYTHVHRHRDKILIRGYKDGQPYASKETYSPYLFRRTKNNTPYRTLYGVPVEKVHFDSMYEARDYVKRYEGVDGMTVYGLTNFLYAYINDQFSGDVEYDPSVIKVGTIDIEVGVDESSGFPDVMNPSQVVTAITIYFDNWFYVYGCGEYIPHQNNVSYFKCQDESQLLKEFLTKWRELDFDIVTGWNVAGFDIPYLVNRIKKVLGDESSSRLSPWGLIESREFEQYGRKQVNYDLVGTAVLDYLDLYRKFSYTPQESYRLDHIANYELGVGKLDYSEYESLFGLYRENFQKFIEYNVTDVLRVKQLDDKLKFIEMVMAIAYDGKVNYLDTFTSVKMWDIIIHNYLLKKNIVLEPLQVKERDRQIAGGHVKDPQIGMHEWVVSFDLNSLYPMLIQQYNIGPDTFFGHVIDANVDKILDGQFNDSNLQSFIHENNISLCASGYGFKKNKKSFLNDLMEQMYNDRAAYKKKMIEWKQEFERLCAENAPDRDIQNAINNVAKYKNYQLCKKVQLNSVYGSLGNPGFRWYDPKYAESITLSGQLSIRWIEKKFNEYFNRILQTKDVDYIIAIDTDSIYLNLGDFVKKFAKPNWDNQKTVNWVDKICTEKLEPMIDGWYQELADLVNAYNQKMKMKRECIANKGIWTGKKHYILNVYNNEGVAYNEPQLKIMGIEAVRSSTPSSCRINIKKALNVIMNQDESSTQKFIETFREQFMQLPFEEVAFPRSVSDISKWLVKPSHYEYKLGTPIHVKAALNYNKMVVKKGLDKRYTPITDGTKIKFAYLKMPNPSTDTVIGAPDVLPKGLGMDDFINYNMQFDKSFVEPLKTILDAVGWEVEKKNTLESFFT